MRRFLLVTVSILPGAGAILLGRTWSGFALMCVGFFAADFAFLSYSGLWLSAPLWVGPVAATVAGLALLGSVTWTALATSPARQRRREQRVEKAIREASIAYLRDEYDDAARAIDRGLAVARDDVDLVHLAWQVAVAAERTSDAKAYERRLRRLDVGERWSWELDPL